MDELLSRKGLVIVLILVLLVLVPVLFGKVREIGKDDEFAEVLRNGDVPNPHRDLQGKVWTEAELATIEVTALADSTRRPGDIGQGIQNRNALIPEAQHAFQAVITDMATGKKHVFGKRRRGPVRWTWVSIHPDSAREMIEDLRREQETYGRAVSPR